MSIICAIAKNKKLVSGFILVAGLQERKHIAISVARRSLQINKERNL